MVVVVVVELVYSSDTTRAFFNIRINYNLTRKHSVSNDKLS